MGDYQLQEPLNVSCATGVDDCSLLYRYRWLPCAFSAACFYATMAVVTSTLTDEISPTELSFMRGLVNAVLVFIWIIYKGKSMFVANRAHLAFHSMNSIFTAAVIYCQVYSFTHMVAADASAIIYGYIALTGLFGRIILKEPFALFEVSMVAITFTGIILIARPPFLFQFFDASLTKSEGFVPPLVAFGTALLSAAHAVNIRAMGMKDIDVTLVMFYPMAFTAIVMAITAAVFHEWSIPSCTWVRICVFIVALSGGIANPLMVYALSIENPVYVTLVLINDSFLVFVMTVLFFGYKPKWTSVIGIFFIIGSSVAIIVKKIIVYRRLGESAQNSLDSEKQTVTNGVLLDQREDVEKHLMLAKVTSVLKSSSTFSLDRKRGPLMNKC